MRFVILVVGGVATGALSVGAVQTTVSPNGQMFAAVRALGGDMSNFHLGEINPLKAYADVERQITSGILAGSPNFPTSTSIPSFSASDLGKLAFGKGFQLDKAGMNRAFVGGINNQIQQNNLRMQNMATYARNPMGWHGAPPF